MMWLQLALLLACILIGARIGGIGLGVAGGLGLACFVFVLAMPPGQPMTAHWGVPDPAKAEGSEAERMLAFRHALAALERRIGIFVDLPIESLDRLKLQKQLDEIGRTRD